MLVAERTYSVSVHDVDLTGRLTPGALFNFFQDMAARHASALGFGREHLMTTGLFWVLSRMAVRIEKMPVQWDDITIRTWPRGTDAIFAIRDFEMLDIRGRKLAGASSSWLVVDYNTRKVQRPDKALAYLNTEFPEIRALETNAAKITQPPTGEQTRTSIKVRLEDIDVNMHVNNARYIHWVMNCYEPEFITVNTPEMIEVNYISEGHRNDLISIITTSINSESPVYLHSVVRDTDGSDLCRVRITWRKNRV